MTTITAPLTSFALAALVPDVVRSCVVLQPSPPPDPGEEPPAPVTGNDIYTPIAPGVTYANLPVAPTIVDTSPDQMIGCIVTVADNPQGRLNALFPSAVDGDGVIDRATNDIWVYDGATWNNVGPTPGPTITATTVIPPWNEILLAVARTRTKLSVNALAYALELLTEPAPIVTTTAMSVRSVTAYIAPAATDFTLTVHVPSVSSGGSVQVPATSSSLAVPELQVSSGGSAIIPFADFSFAVNAVPYVGSAATVIQPVAASLSLAGPAPSVSSGVNVSPDATSLATAFAVPLVSTKSPPVASINSSGAVGGAAINVTYTDTQTNDILLLVVETSGDASTVTPNIDYPEWNVLTGTPVTDVASTAGSKLQIWWTRATAPSSFNSIVFDDSGDHQIGKVYTIRGCATTGDPFDVIGTSTKTTASTTATAPSVTTTVPQALIFSIISQPVDTASTTQFGAPSNSVLTSLTDFDEFASSSANGGGFVISTGVKKTPGETGVTTYSTAPNSTNASIVIAFKP
jgi:hypothetical protein